MAIAGQRRKRGCNHPYLTGNFAPIHQIQPLTTCSYSGSIPKELAGGQYVRNGGNPVLNEDLGRDAHWFDGDGMLSGVAFPRSRQHDGDVHPEFVNQYILTDCLLSSITSPTLRSPILPSISTLVNPASGLIRIIVRILRTLLLVLLSHLPGSKQSVKRISVANTGIFYHDGRALATCESGPPIRVQLPTLETVGWFNGHHAEGEGETKNLEPGFGGEGILSFMNEWTTGHPKVDPHTKQIILYHCTFAAPYVHYSVLPSSEQNTEKPSPIDRRKILNAPVPGVSGAKMMHDFGVSSQHTVIMDLPLALDPLNLLRNKPVVAYDSSKPSRFGVFPRSSPSATRWFDTSACCIFHTANTWDEVGINGHVTAVNMMACRLTSASLVFSAGNIAAPPPTRQSVEEVEKAMPFFSKYDYDEPCLNADNTDPERIVKKHTTSFSHCAFDRAPAIESTALIPKYTASPQQTDLDIEEEQCRLYYYRFSLSSTNSNIITHQFALSAIPFEFPTLHPVKEMSSARYVYGCSTSSSSFGAALGRAVKIDIIAKIDALTLISRARSQLPRPVTGCVDTRSVFQVLRDNASNPNDAIRCFRMPEGWYAQEARFVPRANQVSEDDGFLLFYAFDESQLDDEGECHDSAVSELWILDAKDMQDVVCRVKLPQRVPYGLHGNWFTEEQIIGQRSIERFRKVPELGIREERGMWERVRDEIVRMVG